MKIKNILMTAMVLLAVAQQINAMKHVNQADLDDVYSAFTDGRLDQMTPAERRHCLSLLRGKMSHSYALQILEAYEAQQVVSEPVISDDVKAFLRFLEYNPGEKYLNNHFRELTRADQGVALQEIANMPNAAMILSQIKTTKLRKKEQLAMMVLHLMRRSKVVPSTALGRPSLPDVKDELDLSAFTLDGLDEDPDALNPHVLAQYPSALRCAVLDDATHVKRFLTETYFLENSKQEAALVAFSAMYPDSVDLAREGMAFLAALKGNKPPTVYKKLEDLRLIDPDKYKLMHDVVITIKPIFAAKLATCAAQALAAQSDDQ